MQTVPAAALRGIIESWVERNDSPRCIDDLRGLLEIYAPKQGKTDLNMGDMSPPSRGFLVKRP